MDYRKNTPVDHARTTRQHAGEALKNGANAPGLAGAAVAVIALTVGLFAVATGHPVGGTITLIVAAVLGALSAACPPQGARRRTALARRVFRPSRAAAQQLRLGVCRSCGALRRS